MAAPLSAATTGTSGNFTYSDDGNSITITGYPQDAVGAVKIPSTINSKPVTSIGESAFADCTGLSSVSIPSSVTSIGNSAFFNCYRLTSVSIPSSVTSIGYSAFSYCTGLASFSVDAANPNYSSSDGVLFNKLQTSLIQCPAGKSGAYAIPSSVTSIGNYAFSICTGLTSVSIPSSVTSIGNYAFSFCNGLTSVSIPSSVISIGDFAFYDCTWLTSMSIPSSAISIGDYAFSGCSVLSSVAFKGNAPALGNSAFDEAASGFTLYYLSGSSGFTTPTWHNYPTKIILTQTIRFTVPTAKLMGVAPFDLVATASSALPVTFSVVSGPATLGLNGKTLSLTGAGTVVLQATQPGNSAYLPAPAVQVSFKVSQTAQTITFAPPATRLMNAPPLTLTATATSKLPVTFRVVSGPASLGDDGKTLTLNGAGSVVLKATQAGNAIYLPAVTLLWTIKVSQVAQKITFKPVTTALMTASPLTLAATSTSGLPVSFTVVSGPGTLGIDGKTLTLTGAGSVVVKATQAGNAIYLAAPAVQATIKVSKVAQAITFTPPTTVALNVSPLTLTATASSGLPVAYVVTGPASLVGQSLNLTGVGTVTVKASQAGNTVYNAAVTLTKTIKVTAAVVAKSLVSKSSAAPADISLDGNYTALLVGADTSSSPGLPIGGVDLRVDTTKKTYTALLTLVNEAEPLFISGTVDIAGTDANSLITAYWPEPGETSPYTVEFALSGDGLVVTVSQAGQVIAETSAAARQP